ncbi:hypothetical protein [Paenibacillus humicola]|uniref:hypothetical protein n=1 Tax=Paenibacillus humicola TaxID=3110540 RepID=UPI00237A581B|nr:hypothetical protein [Paenibacillus humicola]
MNAQLAFPISTGAALLSFTLIVIWYVIPGLSKRPREEALLPLVLLNTFRFMGLMFLFPQVTGGPLPPDFAVPAAYGDLLTAVLAIIAAIALRLRSGLALPLVWLFNLVGFLDLLFATFKGVTLDFPSFQVGVTWIIPTLYVPLLMVAHVSIFWLLLRTSKSVRAETV